MNPTLIEALEDARSTHERGEPLDLESFRQQLGTDYAHFRELLAFDTGVEDALEPQSNGALPETLGSYELVREVGRGAMGVVYEAHDTKLDRKVAIKALRPDLDVRPSTATRYEREARSCARVRHPHLIEIYEVGDVDGRPYYVMPLLGGGPLSRVLREGARLSPQELCARMADVADAVHALHEAQIVHRDIKPANIVVEDDGRFVLADFGLARRTDVPALTQTGQSVGTPHYMSPEQVSGDKVVDARTDIYALGATLYEVLGERRAFDAPDLESLYGQILTKRPVDLKDLAPRVPEPAARVVMKCLEKDPADRYPTAGALAHDLRAAAEGGDVRARRPSPLVRFARSVQPLHIAAIVVVAALVWTMTRESDTPAPAQSETQVVFEIPREHLVEYFRALKEAGLEVQVRIREPEVRRTTRMAPIQLVYPRGRVRLEDLDRMRVDVTDAFDECSSLPTEDSGSFRSAPAQKARPAPVTIATHASSSVRSCSHAAFRSRRSWPLTAFSESGRL